MQNRDGAAVRGIRAAPAILWDDATTISGPRCPQTAPASRCPRPMSAGTPPYGDGARNGRPSAQWTMAHAYARARDRGSCIALNSLRDQLVRAQLQKLSELEQNPGGTSINLDFGWPGPILHSCKKKDVRIGVMFETANN